MKNLKKYGLSERFINEATLYPEYKIARVISQHKNSFKIITDEGEMRAEISGKFRYETTRLVDQPAVGDFVMVSFSQNDTVAMIHNVLTRKSSFERSAVGVSNETQVVASNIDIVFLCMSLNNNYKLSRMERYLSVAWNSGATPVIILTKSDLCEDVNSVVSEIENIAIGTDILVTSCFNKEACDKILSYMKEGVTASFIGSSGVGKSTLINTIAETEIMHTSEIRSGDDKGRHTTTGRELILLPQGGVVIDTPGMRELGVESVDLSKSFSDIDELIGKCKFSDCTHTNEPGCAVRKAVEDGILDERRLQNYEKLKKEAKYDGLSSKQIEEEKVKMMFGSKNGMKKMKDHLKNKKR